MQMPLTYDWPLQQKWAINRPPGEVLKFVVAPPVESTLGTMFLAINREEGTMAIAPLDKDSFQTAVIERRASAAVEELDRYKTFAHRWDGYHANPFSTIVLDAAKILVTSAARLMSSIPEAGAIIPGPAPDGSVDVELRFRDKRLIFTIYPSPDGVEVHTYREHQNHSEETQSVASNALGANLHWLVS